MIRRPLSVTLVAGLLVLAAGQARAADDTSHLAGGGTASISQVAMNVTLDGAGSASGSFECLMAGRSGFAGLSNPGKEEGFYLEIPGTIFVEGGAGGRIEPAGLGISTFSVVNEHRG